jgi:hypothetical protein
MNQTPEELARDNIDRQLAACGWIIQHKRQIDLGAGIGVAVREYQTEVGPADYILFVDRKPVGVIEAKKEEEGIKREIIIAALCSNNSDWLRELKESHTGFESWTATAFLVACKSLPEEERRFFIKSLSRENDYIELLKKWSKSK